MVICNCFCVKAKPTVVVPGWNRRWLGVYYINPDGNTSLNYPPTYDERRQEQTKRLIIWLKSRAVYLNNVLSNAVFVPMMVLWLLHHRCCSPVLRHTGTVCGLTTLAHKEQLQGTAAVDFWSRGFRHWWWCVATGNIHIQEPFLAFGHDLDSPCCSSFSWSYNITKHPRRFMVIITIRDAVLKLHYNDRGNEEQTGGISNC